MNAGTTLVAQPFMRLLLVVIRLPADYFSRLHSEAVAGHQRSVVELSVLAAKNVVGVLALIFGLVLTLPGMPGPGIVMIVVGLSLLSFRQKAALLRWVLSRPGVLNRMNGLRQRAGRAPLVLG